MIRITKNIGPPLNVVASILRQDRPVVFSIIYMPGRSEIATVIDNISLDGALEMVETVALTSLRESVEAVSSTQGGNYE